MSLGTNLISGLSSGFDWRSMIDKLIAVEHRRVDLVIGRKSEYEDKLSEWQSFNTKLLSLKTSAASLTKHDDFNLYLANMSSNNSEVAASDLLSVSATSSASVGSYSIKVSNLATAQKVSSSSFSSFSDALGSTYAGDILINGKTVNIGETDSLADVRDKINNANGGTNPTGVTANIVTYAANDYRLILTNDDTGADGISLKNGSSDDLLELFGFKDKTASVKNSITGGAQSDTFINSTQDIKTLLGLSTSQSGTIQILDGNSVYQNINIDFSSDSLEDIKTNINNAGIVGVSASIVVDTSKNQTTYSLQIDGSQDFIDSQNMLETLGVLHNGVSDAQGTTSGNTMTADGVNITASSLITSIDGYNTFTAGGSPGGDFITISGNDHNNNPVNTTFNITSTATVQDLLDAVEAAFEANGSDVSVYVTSEGKIEVADMDSGASSLSVSLASTIQDSYSSLNWGAFSALDVVRERELVSGQDASLIIDGVTIMSSDNSVDDVLPGVTLNLLKSDIDTTITLNVNRDVNAIINKISTFINSYNEVTSYILEQQTYDDEEETTGGILFGDSTLTSVKSDLTSTLLESIWGVSFDFSTLGLAGINLNKEGQLSINDDALRGYLESNFNDIRNLFSVSGASNAGALEYISYSRDTAAGEYEVYITNAATRSLSTSDNSTVGADETLTIAIGDNTAEIELTTGMTTADIVNAINAELDKVYTQTLTGDNALTSSGSPITASTKWTEIDGTNLGDGNKISFSGTNRDGNSIQGFYEITDEGNDTVQGLLNAIESTYDNEVTASIDSAGKIVITDKFSGSSQLAITFDYTEADVLSFGSEVSTENDGGVSGRYAMAITATDDGSGHLVLTHDNYGSDYNFTISESASNPLHKLWTSGDQDVDNGEDVAGTINGETATGLGQILTGDSGENNIDGLVIKYTGQNEDLNVGEVSIALGVAELFDRTLHNITDQYDGYLAFKQESLQNSINDFEEQVETMEARLERRMETMVERFVAMESALAHIQTLSAWLSSQVTTLYSGWK